MSEIKVVIQLLCQQLNILLKTDLKPENFRLAKFNNNDENTVRELWSALWKLTRILGATSKSENQYPMEFEVQLYFLSRSYDCVEFYCLPSESSTGSRELLLALMWLIASENTLPKLIFEHVRQSPLCQEYPEYPDDIHCKSSKLKLLSEDVKLKLNLQDQMNYCLWLANRLKYNLNKLHDLHQERISKTHKIHVATSGASGLPHLSAFETKLVHDPEFLKQHLPGLSLIHELLDIHTKWTKKRSIFWDWMETVMDLKEKEITATTTLLPDQERSLAKFIETLNSYLNSINPKDSADSFTTRTNLPRFFISSSFSKSTNNLMRKASSSDLLSDVETSVNGIISQASDLLSHLNSNLQHLEQHKTDRVNELHSSLRTLSEKIGVIVINDNSTTETESEDCSK